MRKCCIEVLYVEHLLEHKTERPFKIEVWTGQQHSHYATAWTWAQSETLGGADDVGSTVEQDRSHLAEQVEYAGERCRFADETRSKSSSRQAGRNDGLHIS